MATIIAVGAVSAENRIVSSYDGTTNAGQLANGRPPMFIGYSITDAQYCSANPVAMPVKAAGQHQRDSRVRFRWMMSLSSSTGTGVYASTG